jgi:hypothetical protein
VAELTEREQIIKSLADRRWSDQSIFFGETWLGIPTLRIVEVGALCGGSATM